MKEIAEKKLAEKTPRNAVDPIVVPLGDQTDMQSVSIKPIDDAICARTYAAPRLRFLEFDALKRSGITSEHRDTFRNLLCVLAWNS